MTIKGQRKANMLFACDFTLCSTILLLYAPPKTCFLFLKPLSLLLLLLHACVRACVRAGGAAWVRAALVRDPVCRTSCPACPPINWAALTCSACASLAFFHPYAFIPLIFPLPHSFPLMSANGPVHNSCAPNVSPQLKCET